MAITLRTNKGSALTYDEMDKNFSQYFYSASRIGNTMTLYYTGSTNLAGYGPSRTIDINLNPAEGQDPNLVVQGANRSIQFREGSLLAGEATFVYSSNNYLGIGTAQPSVLVEAQGNTATQAILKLTSHDSISTTSNKMAYMLFNRGTTSIGAIGKVDPLTDHISLQSLTPDSFLTLGASLNTNPNAHIFINGQSGNIGVGTYGPGAKLETAINGASGKTLIFGRGLDGGFNLAGKQDHGSNADGAVIGSIGLDYINQENTAIRFHRGADGIGGYMSFTVKDGTPRMQLSNTGTLTINSEFNYPSVLNAQGNIPGLNLYATVQNEATTQYSQAVIGVKAGNAQMFEFGQNRDGYGFLFNPNNQPIYFMTNTVIRLAISGPGKVGIGIGGNTPQGQLHIAQTDALPAAVNSTTLLKTFEHRGGSDYEGSVTYIRDYARRIAGTTDNWLTWAHHNSIDIDGVHNTPGTDTRSWWERSPYSGSHAFGTLTTTTLKTVSGFGKNMVLVGHSDEFKHPTATLSVFHPTNPTEIQVGHTTVSGPHKVVINGGGFDIDYGYYLSGSTTTETFFKTNTGTPSIGELGSNGTTVAKVDGPNNVFTITGKLAATPAARPANVTAAGIPGEIRINPSPEGGVYYMYVCIASNNWKRVALSSFS
jgi:hypothetical protein